MGRGSWGPSLDLLPFPPHVAHQAGPPGEGGKDRVLPRGYSLDREPGPVEVVSGDWQHMCTLLHCPANIGGSMLTHTPVQNHTGTTWGSFQNCPPQYFSVPNLLVLLLCLRLCAHPFPIPQT